MLYLYNRILFTGYKYEYIAAKLEKDELWNHNVEWKPEVVEDNSVTPFV